MWLDLVKTQMGKVICHRGGVGRLLSKKLVANQTLIGAVLSISFLAACAASQNSSSLSVSSISSSSDIVISRSAVAPNLQLTNIGSPAVIENNGIPVNSVINTGNAPQQPFSVNLSNVSQNEDVAARVIDTIIWQIQTGPVPSSPVDPVVPEGQDPSLTEDALEAAFALLSNQAAPPSLEPEFILPSKKGLQLRVGLLVPLTGPYAALGDEIRRGAEMALFQAVNKNVQLLFLDTMGGEKAANAALIGVKNDVDIFIGPLFTPAVLAAW